MLIPETPREPIAGKWSAGVKRLRLAASVTVCVTLLVSGCANGTVTVTGKLVGSDGHCLYVDVIATDRYYLRNLPSDYVAEDVGFGGPDGSHFRFGDSVTVSGTLSFVPFDRQCDGAHTLDATAIK